MKFSIKDFFSKCDQIHSSLRIWSYLLKNSLNEIFDFLETFELDFLQFSGPQILPKKGEISAQLEFTCSKSTMKTPIKITILVICSKLTIKVNNKRRY